MDRPKMDRPRELKGTPLTREAGRLLKAGLLITAIVLVVGSLPVVLLWLWADDLEEPGANLGYVDEPLRFRNGDVEISGVLRMPAFGGPHPALVVAHGSGRATRDRFYELAENLAINGYAVLTYDKRGVGESGGEYAGVGPDNSETMFDLLAGDVIAGVSALAARPDILGDRIGLLGVSQGGWIAPLAAARSDRVAFMIVISGPTVTVGEEIHYSELTGEREGLALELDDEALSARLAAFDGPHGYDPVPVLEGLDIPGLWILGAEDRSIPIPETLGHLERLTQAGHPYAVELLPGVGHGMRDLGTGEAAPTFSIMFRWLVRTLGSVDQLAQQP